MSKKQMEKELPDGITQEMIDSAKAKYGADKVKLVEILSENGSEVEKTVLVIVPSRSVVGHYRRYSETDPKKADEIMVKNCLLSHLDEVLADDKLFYGALAGVAELIPVRKAAIKNC
jgi:hypothetical protein